MRGIIANLATVFSVQGLRSALAAVRQFAARVRQALADFRLGGIVRLGTVLSGAVAGARRLATAFGRVGSVVARVTRQVATLGARIGALSLGAIGVGSVGGIPGAVVASNQGFLREIEAQRRSQAALAIGAEEQNLLTGLGRRFGLDIQDMTGGLVQFSERVGRAAREGNEFFTRLGIRATDAAGRLRPTFDVLVDVARATQGLNSAARGELLSSIFGDDDAAKFAPLLEFLGNLNDREIVTALRDIRGATPLFDERDIRDAQRYRFAWEELGDAVRELRLNIFRTTSPELIQFFEVLAALLRQNSVAISEFVGRQLSRAISIVYDLIDLFFGIPASRNPWLNEVGPAITGTIDAIVSAFRMATEIARDAFYIFSGQDYNATSEYAPAIKRIRDQIVAFAEMVFEKMVEIAARVQGFFAVVVDFFTPLIAAASAAWADFNAGLNGAGLREVEGVFGVLGIAVRELTDFVREFGEAFYAVFIEQQDQVAPKFQWLVSVREGLEQFSAALETAWGWFRDLFDAIDSVLGLFGQDLTSLLLFIGLLRLSGLLPVILGGFRSLGRILGGIGAVAGRVGAGILGATGASGILASLGALSGAGGITGALAAFGAAALPVAVGVAALSAALFVLWDAFNGFRVIKSAMQPLADWIAGVDEAAERTRQIGEDRLNDPRYIESRRRYEEREAARLEREALAAGMREAANRSNPALSDLNTLFAGSSNVVRGIDAEYARFNILAPPAQSEVNLYLNGTGDPVRLRGTQDEIDRLLRSEQFSTARP